DMPPFAWSIFATLAAGATLTMGNPAAPVDDLAYVLDYVRAAVLITTPEVAAALAPRLRSLPALRQILLVPDGSAGHGCEASASPPAALGSWPGAIASLADVIARGRR